MCLKLEKKLHKQVSVTNDVTHVDDVKHQYLFDSINVDDLHRAELESVRLVQANTFPDELNIFNSLNKVLMRQN